MLTLNSLKACDPSLRVIASTEDDPAVKTLCALDSLRDHSVIFIKDIKYYKKLLTLFNGAVPARGLGVVFQESLFGSIDVGSGENLFKNISFYAAVASVDLAMSHFSKLFFDEFDKDADDLVDGRKTGTAKVHPSSRLAENVFLGKGVTIAANVMLHPGSVILSHSHVGENTVLYPNVAVCRNVTIGKDCRIHANTTIGSDGYGYNYDKGEHRKLWHFGGVLIGDSVEIGSNTSIDQGTFSPTLIGSGTKIDNQVHLAHNCKIGKGVLITGQAGFGGSVTLGDYVAMGGCANFAPGVHVGNYAQIGGMAGVTSDVPEKGIYGGHPARPLSEWLRTVAVVRKLSLKSKKKSPKLPKEAVV